MGGDRGRETEERRPGGDAGQAGPSPRDQWVGTEDVRQRKEGQAEMQVRLGPHPGTSGWGQRREGQAEMQAEVGVRVHKPGGPGAGRGLRGKDRTLTPGVRALASGQGENAFQWF